MTMSNKIGPTVGMPVMTSDGQDLGKVKEIMGDCFKVDAPMAADYWLGADTISGDATGAVRLTFTKSALDNEKMDKPGHMGKHKHD